MSAAPASPDRSPPRRRDGRAGRGRARHPPNRHRARAHLARCTVPPCRSANAEGADREASPILLVADFLHSVLPCRKSAPRAQVGPLRSSSAFCGGPATRPGRDATRALFCGRRVMSCGTRVSASYQLLASPRMSERVSIVLPCLNEIATVASVVTEAKEALCRARGEGEVLVVDNGSTDGSPEAAAAAGPRRVPGGGRGAGGGGPGGVAAGSGGGLRHGGAARP